MENTLSDLPTPFAAPIEPAELTKLLVSLMPANGHPYLMQLRMLEIRQDVIEQAGGEFVPYTAGISEFVDIALKPLIEGQALPTTWLEVARLLTKAKDYHLARTATFYALGWPAEFGDIRE